MVGGYYHRQTDTKQDVRMERVAKCEVEDILRDKYNYSEANLQGVVEWLEKRPPDPRDRMDTVPIVMDDRISARERITSSEIRLLKLLPGHKDDELQANIELFSFRSNIERPGQSLSAVDATELRPRDIATKMPKGFKYEALSYTWGDKKIVGTIQINEGDKRFEIGIRQNLMAALKTLRRLPSDRGRGSQDQSLRNFARQHPEAAFELLRKAIEADPNGDRAMDLLRVLFPDEGEESRRNLFETTRTLETHPSNETEIADRIIQLFQKNSEEDDDESLVRWLWIDAICIDQEDHIEKSRQIPRMSDIYMRADNVCVWLGEEIYKTDTDSSLAMDFVEEVLANWDDISKILHNKEREWNAFMTLIRRPWFSRRWIVQEITRAKTATIFCGNKQVKWDRFADVISLFKQYQRTLQDRFKRSEQLDNDPERIGELEELSAIRLVHASDHLFRRDNNQGISEKLLPLEGLMSTLTAFEASEPKDIVYAIVWLAHDAVPVSKEAFTLNSRVVAVGTEITEEVDRRASRAPSRRQSIGQSPARQSNGLAPNIDVAALDAAITNAKSLNGTDLKEERPALGIGLNRVDHHGLGRPQLDLPGQAGSAVQSQSVIVPRQGSGKPTESDLDVETKQRMEKAGVTGMTPEQFAKRFKTLTNLMSMLTYKRFIIDYEKSLFDVCYDFLRFCIDRSKRRDLICRPWAPEPDERELRNFGQLPSWIRRISQHGNFSKHYGGPIERINADPLVGRPGTGVKPFYTADRGIRAVFKTLWDKDDIRNRRGENSREGPTAEQTDKQESEAHFGQDWMTIPAPQDEEKAALVREQKRCLLVRGFVIDQVSRVHPPALGGTIPLEWLAAVGWNDPEKDELDDYFWRMLVGNRDLSGDRAPALWKRACQQVFKKRVQGGDLNTKRLLLQSHLSEPTSHFLKRVESMVFRRSLLELSYAQMYAEQEIIERRKLRAQKAKERQERPEIFFRNPSIPVITRQVTLHHGTPRVITTPKGEEAEQGEEGEETAPGDEDNNDQGAKEDKFALGACDTQVGDVIAIIFGCSVPVVLRKVEKSRDLSEPWSWTPIKYDFKLPRKPPQHPEPKTAEEEKKRADEEDVSRNKEEKEQEPDRFQLIGECYVHGKMDGEAWTIPNIFREIRTFTLV